MGSAGKACPYTMTADESEAGELALEPLLTCKLCLCDYSMDQMTTLQECSCIFCTSVRSSSAFTLQEWDHGRQTDLQDGVAFPVQEAYVIPADRGCFPERTFGVSLCCLI